MKTIYQKLFFIIILMCVVVGLEYKENIFEIAPDFHLKNDDYKVQVKTQKGTLQLPIDEYLIGVLAGEMPVSFELEALKAQAVASRTFVLSRNLKVDNTTNSQVYLSHQQMKDKWGKNYNKNKQKIQKAIQQTHNIVMKYKNQYVSALFFSSSNGKTANCEDYFQGSQAYLKAVDSPWDEEYDPHFIRSKTFTAKQLSQKFQIPSLKINITSYTTSGYVDKVIINQKVYTGRQVREKLNLASSCFQIQLTSKGYVFTTKGSGHGVGMSQYGAQGMAKENKSYQEILNHYYKNIELVSI